MDLAPSRQRRTTGFDTIGHRPDCALRARRTRSDDREPPGPDADDADDHGPGCADASGVSTFAPHHLT
jgi:hypothetical protein